MPKYEVDVKGDGNNVPTHLTVITDRDNGTKVMKQQVAVNNGNATSTFNPSAENLAARSELAQAAVNSVTVREAANKAKASGKLWNAKKNENALKAKSNMKLVAQFKENQKKQNTRKAAENTQALINTKQTAMQNAIAAQKKSEQNAPSEANAVAEAEAAAVEAIRAAKKMEWALLTRNNDKKAEAQQLARDAEALKSQAIKARSDERSKKFSIQLAVDLATSELKEAEAKKAAIEAEQRVKETKKAALEAAARDPKSQAPNALKSAVAKAVEDAKQAREAANQASVEADKFRQAKPFDPASMLQKNQQYFKNKENEQQRQINQNRQQKKSFTLPPPPPGPHPNNLPPPPPAGPHPNNLPPPPAGPHPNNLPPVNAGPLKMTSAERVALARRLAEEQVRKQKGLSGGRRTHRKHHAHRKNRTQHMRRKKSNHSKKRK